MSGMWALRTTGKEADAPAKPMAKAVAGGSGGIEGAGRGGRGACFQLACHPWPVDGLPTDWGSILGFGGWGQGRDTARPASPRPAVLQLGEGAGQSVVHRDGVRNKAILLSLMKREPGPWEDAAGASGKSRALEALGLPITPCFPTKHPAPPAPGLEQTLRCPEWTQDEREQIAFITHAAAMMPTR